MPTDREPERPALTSQGPVANSPVEGRTWVVSALFGLLAIAYLALAAWTEAGLPFPTTGFVSRGGVDRVPVPWPEIPMATYWDTPSDLVYPLDEPFRSFAAPLALLGLAAGLGLRLLRPHTIWGPIGLTGLVFLGYTGYLAWAGWSLDLTSDEALPGYLRELRVHTTEHEEAMVFSMIVEVLGIVMLIVVSSVWAGVAMSELYRALRAKVSEEREAPTEEGAVEGEYREV